MRTIIDPRGDIRAHASWLAARVREYEIDSTGAVCFKITEQEAAEILEEIIDGAIRAGQMAERLSLTPARR